MKMLRFPKQNQAANALPQTTWQEDLILGRNDFNEFLAPPIDDFNLEIEITRASRPLMAILRVRAMEPATFSLQEVKRQIEIEP